MEGRPRRVAAGPVRPIVVPLWLGAERRGVERGAEAIASGLWDRLARSQHGGLDTRLLPPAMVPAPEPDDADQRRGQRDLAFLPEVSATCGRLADEVAATIARDELALILGGDHALSAGSIAGSARTAERLGVLWIDSHADLNIPESSPSGHLHGMGLAAALGNGPEALVRLSEPGAHVQAADICLLGIRDLDPFERDTIAGQEIWMLTMEEWSDRGLIAGLDDALAYLTGRGVDAVHVSFDLDVLDPVELRGTGVPVPGGLTYREAASLLRRLRGWDGPVCAVDWVELNPVLDPSGRSTRIAVELLATLLGATQR
jgi:arginase